MDTSQVALLARYEAVRGGRPNYPEKLHQYQVCPNGGQFKYDTATPSNICLFNAHY